MKLDEGRLRLQVRIEEIQGITEGLQVADRAGELSERRSDHSRLCPGSLEKGNTEEISMKNNTNKRNIGGMRR